MKERAISGKTFAIGLIGKYRAVLMGTAILCILFCHLDLVQRKHGLPVSGLGMASSALTMGVDIFMFLSGFGLYCSFSRKKPPYGQYVKHRVSKLLPSYLAIAGTVYLVKYAIIDREGILSFFKRLFFVPWFAEGVTHGWFILAILVFYLVFPLIYRLVETIGRMKWRFAVWGICAAGYCLLAQAGKRIDPTQYKHFMIAIERFPVFVFGAICGQLFKREDKEVPMPLVLGIILAGVVATLLVCMPSPLKAWVRGLPFFFYFSKGLMALSAIAAMSCVAERLGTCRAGRALLAFLSWMGGFTLHLYLLHSGALQLFDYPPTLHGYLLLAVAVPLTVAVAIQFVLKAISGRP